ncbi:cell envelope integrity protein CreD [Parapedobacter tibetensis]|uniref:cell envelope integrity protein CreD n=1 Tax=Parapedobacter tibetensis TaxID=2972951 RepID=UPI00214DD4FC|nr:cell envelope integrity protein CreD [Parapedobacter tibetensis]
MKPEQQRYGLGQWLSRSVSAKLLFIGTLILLLLIPSLWISSLIEERQHRQQSVVREIGQKWSGQQVIGGPVMVVPYKTMIKTMVGEVEKFEERIQYLYVLPDELEVAAQTKTELLYRGIFKAVVYQAKLQVKGHFGPLDLARAKVAAEDVQWDEVRLAVGVGDLKGLKNNPNLDVGGQVYEPETDFSTKGAFSQNLMVAPDLGEGLLDGVPFRFELDLKGSESLHFIPLAKNTIVSIQGDWATPSFGGSFLPETRKVDDTGFTASWQVPHFSRKLPQQWTSDGTTIQGVWNDFNDIEYYTTEVMPGNSRSAYADVQEAEAFGVHFLQPVDHYQKAERTAKYAILIILLTFVSLFFTEIITKKRIHIIQYLLIGAAMIVYYCLLLSFAEHVGFNMAYFIASSATIILVSVFIAKLLGRLKMALLFAAIMSFFYLFIFTIIQLQDMALLFGSIGLFITIALLMYFSGRINWQQEEEQASK